MALPTMAQTFGTKYAEKPSVVFQSTSTMIGSGSSYSVNPTLNTDGTASYSGATYSPAQVSGGPRRIVNPGDEDDDENGSPIGDAVLPLLLCALAFCGVVYLRKRKAQA